MDIVTNAPVLQRKSASQVLLDRTACLRNLISAGNIAKPAAGPASLHLELAAEPATIRGAGRQIPPVS
jgi:hypothetical protein